MTLHFSKFLIIVCLILIFHLILKFLIDETIIDKYFKNVYKKDILLKKCPRLIFIFPKKERYLELKKKIKTKEFIREFNNEIKNKKIKYVNEINENNLFNSYSFDLKIKFNNKKNKIIFIINNNYINLESIFFLIDKLFNLKSPKLKMHTLKFNFNFIKNFIKFRKYISTINPYNLITLKKNKKIKYYTSNEILYNKHNNYLINKNIPINIIALYNSIINIFNSIYSNNTNRDSLIILIYNGFESNYYCKNNYGGLIIIFN
jgi:hypothetical protein